MGPANIPIANPCVYTNTGCVPELLHVETNFSYVESKVRQAAGALGSSVLWIGNDRRQFVRVGSGSESRFVKSDFPVAEFFILPAILAG